MPEPDNLAFLKKEAALQAVEFVKDGLNIAGVPTSENTRILAVKHGITICEMPFEHPLDLTVDGADEAQVDTLNLIKGRGGALLREKIVASNSAKMIVIVDESKLVTRLGSKTPVPVEIVPFGWQATSEHLKELGGEPVLRLRPDGKPYVTDGGNYILDCRFASIGNPEKLATDLKMIVGVIETGLFIGVASLIIAAKRGGVQQIERPGLRV